MSRRVFAKIAFALFVALPTCSFAGEAEDLLMHFSWWEGKWAVEIKEGDNVITNEVEIVRHEPGCHLITGGGVSIWGYDPERKKWVGNVFSADGAFTTTVLEKPQSIEVRPGIRDRARSRARTADGRIILGEQEWLYIDDETAKMNVKRKTEEGETLPPVELNFRRLKS